MPRSSTAGSPRSGSDEGDRALLRRVRQIARHRLRPVVRAEVRAELAGTDDDLGPLGAGHPDAPVTVLPWDLDLTPAATIADLPLPPTELWTVPVDFLEGGAGQIDSMFGHLFAAGFTSESVGPVLEFGCGSARLLRHLLDHAREHEVWGVDIDAERIAWNQQHLSPPFRFAACSAEPHLPFEDNRFGLTYAGSVFTHIARLADAWLLELLRVTRPGGYLYLTVQDGRWIEATRDRAPEDQDWMNVLIERHGAVLDGLGTDAAVVAVGDPDLGPMVFHDRDALVHSWSQFAEVVSYNELAFYNQSAVVLRKGGSAVGQRP